MGNNTSKDSSANPSPAASRVVRSPPSTLSSATHTSHITTFNSSDTTPSVDSKISIADLMRLVHHGLPTPSCGARRPVAPDLRNRAIEEAPSDSVTAASASIFCVPWWRWGESNPRPSLGHRAFSGRIL